MKSILKICTLILLFNSFIACTVEEINEDKNSSTEEVYATGDDTSGEIDDERDDEEDGNG